MEIDEDEPPGRALKGVVTSKGVVNSGYDRHNDVTNDVWQNDKSRREIENINGRKIGPKFIPDSDSHLYHTREQTRNTKDVDNYVDSLFDFRGYPEQQ